MHLHVCVLVSICVRACVCNHAHANWHAYVFLHSCVWDAYMYMVHVCLGAYVCLSAYGDYRTTSGGIPQVPNTLVFETGLSLAWRSPNTLLRCLASEPQESAWLHLPHPHGFNMDSGACP